MRLAAGTPQTDRRQRQARVMLVLALLAALFGVLCAWSNGSGGSARRFRPTWAGSRGRGRSFSTRTCRGAQGIGPFFARACKRA